jgi:hypothetical protein
MLLAACSYRTVFLWSVCPLYYLTLPYLPHGTASLIYSSTRLNHSLAIMTDVDTAMSDTQTDIQPDTEDHEPDCESDSGASDSELSEDFEPIFDGPVDADGELHGECTQQFSSDGAKFTGTFVHGARHGNGKFCFPDGASLSGVWDDKKLSVQGTYTESDGSCLVGTFDDDFLLNGDAKEFSSDGKLLFTGQYERSMRYVRITLHSLPSLPEHQHQHQHQHQHSTFNTQHCLQCHLLCILFHVLTFPRRPPLLFVSPMSHAIAITTDMVQGIASLKMELSSLVHGQKVNLMVTNVSSSTQQIFHSACLESGMMETCKPLDFVTAKQVKHSVIHCMNMTIHLQTAFRQIRSFLNLSKPTLSQ